MARKGAIAARDQGLAHRWNAAEAKTAGRKGGKKSGETRRKQALDKRI